jgi:hypothetical protein
VLFHIILAGLILYGLMLGRISCLSTKRMMQSVELYGQQFYLEFQVKIMF